MTYGLGLVTLDVMSNDMAYNATYASLRSRGVRDALLHRATVVVVAKAIRTGRTTASVLNAFKASQ